MRMSRGSTKAVPNHHAKESASERNKSMNTRWKCVAGLFLLVAFAIVGAGSGLATEKKAAPGSVKTEQGTR